MNTLKPGAESIGSGLFLLVEALGSSKKAGILVTDKFGKRAGFFPCRQDLEQRGFPRLSGSK